MILLCENGMCSIVASRSTRFAIATVCIAVSQKLTVDFFCEIKKGENIAVKSTHFWLLYYLVVGGMQTNLVLYIYFLPSHAALQYIRGEETSQSMCKHIISSFLKRRKNVCLRDTNLFYLSN